MHTRAQPTCVVAARLDHVAVLPAPSPIVAQQPNTCMAGVSRTVRLMHGSHHACTRARLLKAIYMALLQATSCMLADAATTAAPIRRSHRVPSRQCVDVADGGIAGMLLMQHALYSSAST